MISLAIADLGTVIRGVSWNKAEASSVPMPGLLPVLRAGNICERLNTESDLVWVPASNVSLNQTLRAGDIAICMSSGSASVVGKTAISEVPWNGSVGAFCAILRADPATCLPEYLAFYLKSPRFRAWSSAAQGANIKNIKKSALEEFKVDLPDLSQQRRTVDILARAWSIVQLRRDAQKKAAELIPALFLKMFGDPATNPKAWPVRAIRDFVAHFEGGKNLLAGSEGGTDYRILKVSAVTSGEYVEAESKPTPEGYEPPENHVIREGDMLFSRANTQELVGATAIVTATNGRTLLPDKLWRFVWAEEVDQIFMHALFQNAHVRRELGKLSSGTSASMRNISQAKLFELRLPVPPLEQQRAFGQLSAAMRSVRLQQDLSLKAAMATFDSLLIRAFSQDQPAAVTRAA